MNSYDYAAVDSLIIRDRPGGMLLELQLVVPGIAVDHEILLMSRNELHTSADGLQSTNKLKILYKFTVQICWHAFAYPMHICCATTVKQPGLRTVDLKKNDS